MISHKKIGAEKKKIIRNCRTCKGTGCVSCFNYTALIDKMAAANIPVDYWFRDMKKFYGEPNFKAVVLEYIENLSIEFDKGLSLCFTGERGRGKTMAACEILKAAIHQKYTTFYTTMVDAVTRLMAPGSYTFRDAVKNFDFFVIDEVDQRFFPSRGSMELYGNHFENMLRSRTQNKMPTIICTNSQDPGQIFDGEFQSSFESLGSQFIKVLHAGGKDARKSEEKL
jgi:DNA replication protein DnaC